MGASIRHATREARLDKDLRELFGKDPADYSPREWCSLREHLRLRVLYLGRFVLFRDHYRQDDEGRWLARREVLASFRSMAAAQKRLSSLPEAEARDLWLEYVEPEPANDL